MPGRGRDLVKLSWARLMSLDVVGGLGDRADFERGGSAAPERSSCAVCGVCSFLPHDVPQAARSIAAMTDRDCACITEAMSGG